MKIPVYPILIVSMLLASGCEKDDEETAVIYDDNALVSMSVTSGPTMDGSADILYDDALELVFEDVNVPVYNMFYSGYHGDTYDVTAKSVYTSTDIYFLFQWEGDDEESLDRQSWYYSSINSMWQQKPKKEPDADGIMPAYEDKFAVIWNVNNSISGFNTTGCGVVCHGPYMATNAAGELGDTWHWKRDRTGPVNQLDDKYITYSTENGRKSDAKTSGGYSNNKHDLTVVSALGDTTVYTVPKYWIPGRTGYFWIMDTEITNGTAKEIVSIDTTTLDLTDEAGNVLTAADFGVTTNVVIPSIYVSAFVGERADVAAYHNYSGGKWTLEIKRALTTSNVETDVQFSDQSLEYWFSIAVFDAAAIAHATPGGMTGIPYKMIFE